MEWPFRRFVKMFDAFQRRTLCDRWEARRSAHIAACIANTNLDSPENDRAGILEKLEFAYDSLIARIWNGGEEVVSEAEEEAWQDPFMRAGRHAAQAVKIRTPVLPGEEVIGSLP